MAQEGWICPRCGKVNAPWVMQCSCNMDTQILPKVGHRVYKIVNGFSIRVNITIKEINRI